jgi:signal transduction histidine kinase
MYTGVFFLIEALFYIILLLIIYFNKNRFKSLENKVYSYLIIFTFLELLMELLLDYVGPLYNKIPLISYPIAKIYCSFIIIWNCTLCIYIAIVSLNMKKQNKYISFTLRSLIISCIFLVLLTFILPLSFNYIDKMAFTSGGSVNMIYISSILYVSIGTLFVLINIKNFKDKRFIPMIVLVTMGTACSYLQYRNPGLLLAVPGHAFITFLMYFTIENPDLIMIEELTKAKILSEQTNDAKSKFLFEVTDDIEDKLDKVNTIYNNINSLNPTPEMKEELFNLKNIIDVARVKIKQTIDVSEIDAKELKLIDNNYNVDLLFNSLYTRFKSETNGKVDFRLNVNAGIPDKLYGDSEKIKQIVSTLLNNSIKYTKEGFIELRVNYIIKYNVCRLIISVEDSGIGMDLYTQNQILSNHEDLTEEEIKNKDNINLNLKMVKKMVNIIGGTFIIESTPNVGTKVKVIIDQLNAPTVKSKEILKIDKYSEELKNKGRLAIITSDKDEVKLINKYIKDNDLLVENYNVTLNCLTNIRNDIKYDYIYIDENMDKIDAKSFLYKAKMVESFTGKVYVITKNKDIRYRKELISYGFAGVITTPISKEEIENIV